MFRLSGTAQPSNSGNGFYIDDVSYDNLTPPPGPVKLYSDNTYATLLSTHFTIQDAIDAASSGNAITVDDGTYNENITLDVDNLTITSINGAASTTIQGNNSSPKLGTVVFAASTSGITFGETGKGFTVEGIDGASPGLEKAAIYFTAAQTNQTVEGNIINANGDAAILTEYAATINGLTINDNTIGGQTFTGANPAGDGFSAQFTLANVPRSGVYIGNSPTKTNIVFTNNNISIICGGTSLTDNTGAAAPAHPQGNTIVTIDAATATITGNTFNGITARYATDLRARGAAAGNTITGNTFNVSTNPGYFYGTSGLQSGVASGNTFAQGPIYPIATSGNGSILSTIQAAIYAASAGDEILVDVASHTEGQIVVDRSVTIKGLGKTSTTLSSDYNTTTGGHGVAAAIWIATDPGTTVHFKDMTFDGTGKDIKYGIVFKDDGSIDNVAINEIKHSASQYLGIAVQVLDGNVDIKNSMFTNIGRIGAHYRMGVILGAAISGNFENNMYTGKGAGDWLDYALDVSGGVNPLTIKNNTISNNKGVALSDGSTSAGILVTSYFPTPANSVANNVTITGNTLSNNTAGVAVGYDASDISVVAINDNDISGNDYGVTSTGPSVDASENYWGAADGPSGAGNGSGDAIEADVNACPFYDGPVVSGNLVSCPIVNTNTSETFFSLQAAIDAPNTLNGHVITIAAGTYADSTVITKELDIRGPNYNISPNTGTRVAEAIFVPAKSESDAIFLIEADNVKINGLTLDGDNTAITTGWTGTNSADIDVYDGIGIYDANNVISVSGVKIENNIIQNVAYFGVDNFGWYNYANPATSGHLVKDNLFQNLGTYLSSGTIDFWGGGVLIYNDNYTRIEDNVMTNVRIGIQTGNFHKANPGLADYQVITNNTIQARRRGIFYNLHTGANVAPLTLSNNTITGLANSNETQWDGILASSLSDATGIISGNTVDGTGLSVPTEGFEAWNVNTNSPVQFIGGEAKNVDVGVFVNNYEGYNSDANNTEALIDGVTLTDGVGTGIYVKDSPSNGNSATVSAEIKGNTDIETNTTDGVGILVEGADASADIHDNLSTIEGNDIGILVDAGSATITNNTIKLNNTGVKFQNAGTGTVSSNNIHDNVNYGVENTTTVNVTATGNWWGEASGPSGEGPGLGDAISIDITACPWLDDVVGTGISTSPIYNQTQLTSHCSINEAIVAATAGDVIEVLSADYTEPTQIAVTKDITLKGQGKTTTVLRPGTSTGTSGDARGFILVDANVTFNLEDLTIDGTGKLVWQAIRQKGDGTVDNVKFTEIKYQTSGSPYAGTAMAAFGTGNVDVTNSDFSEIGRIGVLYFGTGITGSNFTDNTYTGKGSGDWLDYALDISAGAVVTVSNNTISDNIGVASTDGSTSAGILVSTYFSPGTSATITGNAISNNTAGIAVGFNASDASTVVATGNDFSGNDFGITTTAPAVQAINNYWGAADGPSGAGSGSGDAIVAGVNACPYYDGPVATGSPVSCPIQNVTSGEAFFYLQDAIDDPDTDPNDQITVASGSYAGNIIIDKALDIRGANYGVACTGTRGLESALNGSGTTITINANNVSIDGFTITGDVAINSTGRTGISIQNNIISANEMGIEAYASSAPFTVQDNCITLANQTFAVHEFGTNPTVGSSQASGTWYTDRYAPNGFISELFDGDNRLKHSISASDCQSCRPASFSSAFYNTQGRKYDTEDATSASIELYVPAAWATSGERMAGFWGTGYDASNSVSLYPIIEFVSDNSDPRFRVYNNGVWVDLGLPNGFIYDEWYTLSIRIENSEVLIGVNEMLVAIPALGTETIGNIILQGHNTDSPGTTYDIYWDNLSVYGGAPADVNNQTVGIGLIGASGTNALTIEDNNVADAFYGYLVNSVNTSTQTIIEGGDVTGVMQGVAVVNTLDGITYTATNVKVYDVTMSAFVGDYNSNTAFTPYNFHAGVYSFTSDDGSTASPATTLDIEDCDIQGTQAPAQNSAGIEIADFSSQGVTLQNVSVANNTISNNSNRGVDFRGNVVATVTGNTLINNGSAAFGASGNDGYTIIARNGADVTADLNLITHPATSTTDVYAFQTGNAPASSIEAYNNSILMNGNLDGYGAQAGSGDIVATCNWWGTASGPSASLFTGSTITYIPWLITNDLNNPDCTGGRVYNVNTATWYSDIQPAINDASTLNGHVLEVMPGDYYGSPVNGNIGVTKQLEIRGANYNIDPNTGVRGEESVVDGTFSIFNDNITIDGFKMVGDSAALRNDWTNLPGALNSTFSGLTFSNNLVTNKTGTQDVLLFEKTATQSAMATANWSINNNRFVDFEGSGTWVMSLSDISIVDIKDNIIIYNDEDASTLSPILDRKGIRLEACGTVDLSSNTINMGATLTGGMNEVQRDAEFSKAPYAVELVAESTAALGIIISDNTISGSNEAVRSSGSGTIEDLTLTNNSIFDVNYGLSLLPNNAETVAHKDITVETNDISTFKECLFFGAGTSGTYENVQIIKNSLINTLPNYAIQVNVASLIGASTDAIATCNWYGTADYSTVASKHIGPIDFSQYATDSDLSNLQCGLAIEVAAYLEGPFDALNQEMRTDLNAPAPTNILGTYATSQPYNTAPWNYTGSESVAPSFFVAHDSIVDWVLIELRDPVNINTVLHTAAGFICKNGTVIGTDGGPIRFETGGDNDFHMAIRHRNHADVATANSVPGKWDIRYDNSNVYVDGGGNPNLKLINLTHFVLHGGDGDANNVVNTSDIAPILLDFFYTGYFAGDYLMTGFVNGSDINPVSSNFFVTISFP